MPIQLFNKTFFTCANTIQISSIRLLNAQMLNRNLLAFVIYTEMFTALMRIFEYIVISNERRENILIHGKFV